MDREPTFAAAVDVEEFDDTELGAAVRDAAASGIRMVFLTTSRVRMLRMLPLDGDDEV